MDYYSIVIQNEPKAKQPALPNCQEIRHVFLDLDGTIINKHYQVSSGTKEEIRRVTSKGLTVSIASGRPYFAAKDLITELGIRTPCSMFGGAVLVDPVNNNLLNQDLFVADDIWPIVQKARELSLHTELYTMNDYFVERETKYIDIHAGYLGVRAKIADLEQVAKKMPVVKVVIIIDIADQVSLRSQLSANFPGVHFGYSCGAAHPDILFANGISPKASKEKSFAMAIKAMGLNANQVMAIGDSTSDLIFMRLAGVGIAMGNAPQEVKNQADYVTLSVEEDGVAQAFKLLL